MLIIKMLMVGGSVLLLAYFFIAARGRPIEKIGMSAVFLMIAYFALFPKVSDRVANSIGVDRGADLMLYLSTMALLFLCFHLYLQQKQMQSELLAVVRALALLTAREPGGRGGPSPAGTARDGGLVEAAPE